MSKISSITNAQRLLTLAIDCYEGRELQGRLYHESLKGTVMFLNVTQMVLIIEDIFSNIKCPLKAMRQRQFESIKEMSPNCCKPEKLNIEPVENAEALKGRISTIQLKINFRYNASWQGELVWLEKKERVEFKSFYHLLKLLDQGLGVQPTPSSGINEDSSIKGRLYQPPFAKQYKFNNLMELMRLLESSIEMTRNCKAEREEWVLPKRALEICQLRGTQASFIIYILFEQNDTLQGMVFLKETGDKVNFRSFLELVMLIDSASFGWKEELAYHGV